MKEFITPKTRNSPGINFNPDTGKFMIEGKSILEDPATFYEGVFKWLHEYFQQPQPLTTVDIKVEYINSSSSKYLTAFFRILEKYSRDGHKCKVNWHYEKDDESILEFGSHFESTIDLDFSLIEYENQ